MIFQKKCELETCGKEFTHARKTAKFCCDAHRVESYKSKQPVSARRQLLIDAGSACHECGRTEGRLRVNELRDRPVDGPNVIVLCDLHHTNLARSVRDAVRL